MKTSVLGVVVIVAAITAALVAGLLRRGDSWQKVKADDPGNSSSPVTTTAT